MLARKMSRGFVRLCVGLGIELGEGRRESVKENS